jgi:23S rRNA (adenine2030-N6)-methyltransferase
MQLIRFLQNKETGICYFETHAAKAIYNLNDETTQKTQEYKLGIEKLWENPAVSNSAIVEYLDCVKQFNPDSNLSFYPGSGLIANTLLRAQDQEILCELHPTIYAALHDYFRRDKKVHVHHGEGYQTIFSLLPPKCNRGLLLIDPPYEAKDEYKQLITALSKMQTRWSNGVYAIWFPIKEYKEITSFYRELKKLPFKNILSAEFYTTTDNTENCLKGSGMAIINPPWQFDLLLKKMLPELMKGLGIENGKVSLQWVLHEDK